MNNSTTIKKSRKSKTIKRTLTLFLLIIPFSLIEYYQYINQIDPFIFLAITQTGIFLFIGVLFYYKVTARTDIVSVFFEKLGLDYKIINVNFRRYLISKYENVYIMAQDNILCLYKFIREPIKTENRIKFMMGYYASTLKVEGLEVHVRKRIKNVIIPTIDGYLNGRAMIYYIPLMEKFSIDNSKDYIIDRPEEFKPILLKIIEKLQNEVKDLKNI